MAIPPVADRWAALQPLSEASLVSWRAMRASHVEWYSERVFSSWVALEGKPGILPGDPGRLSGGERCESDHFLPTPGGGISWVSRMANKGLGGVVCLQENRVGVWVRYGRPRL